MSRKVTKGKLGNVVFQFNPSSITYGGGANWVSINSPGLKNPYTQYGYGRPSTFDFELWVSELTFREGNAEKTMKLLEEYRESKEPIVFVYSGFATRVIVLECSIVIEALSKTLKPIEIRASISLQKV